MEGLEQLLTTRQVAEILSVSSSTVHRYVREGRIKHIKVDSEKKNSRGFVTNTTLRFRKNDVREFIKANLVSTSDELLRKLPS